MAKKPAIKRPFFLCSDRGDPYDIFGTDDRLRAKRLAEKEILEPLDKKDIDSLFLKKFGKKGRKIKRPTAMADEDINDFLK